MHVLFDSLSLCHRQKKLNAAYDEHGFDCRTIKTCTPFRDPTRETIQYCACLITPHVSV